MLELARVVIPLFLFLFSSLLYMHVHTIFHLCFLIDERHDQPSNTDYQLRFSPEFGRLGWGELIS